MKKKNVSKGFVFRLLKRVGGHWHVGGPGQHQGVDGDKFFCLDKFNKEEKCVVYSFGVATDWTFEDQMVKFGEHQLFSLLSKNLIFEIIRL